MHKKIISLTLVLSIPLFLFSQTTYYWYHGKKQPLEEYRERAFIMVDNPNDTTVVNMLLSKQKCQKIFFEKNIIRDVHYKKLPNYQYYWGIIDRSLSKEFDTICHKALSYITTDDDTLSLSNLFYVQLKNPNDTYLLDSLSEVYNVLTLGSNGFMPDWFTIACTPKTKSNALEISNRYYETGLFVSVEPDFIPKITTLCTNDPFFCRQWHLSNYSYDDIDIGFCEASQITSGSHNVTVAVFDTGIDTTHEDLSNFSIYEYDTETNSSPSIIYSDHGTNSAGVIGATTNNTKGVAGISPDCPLMIISSKLDGKPNTRKKLANGIRFATTNGASVISNSWGWGDGTTSEMLENAIDSALVYGRGGKGCVVVFASGNSNDSVAYPARLNGVISVGAVLRNGNRYNVSNFGAKLKIVAPNGIYTTSSLDCYNPPYYTEYHETSSSCPQVSATAALIMSINPLLTHLEVEEILESTTLKLKNDYNSLYQYVFTPSIHPYGTWNKYIGYGMVNTYRALSKTLSREDTIIGNTIITSKTVFHKNIIIPNSTTLIVEDTLLIGYSKIIIQSGGKLIIDGGVLSNFFKTSFDGVMWQGIEMCDGATLEMRNGARIEYSHNAIRTMVGDDWDHAGGTLRLDSCTFLNCRRAIEFKNCPPNANSYIKRVTFSVDNQNRFADNGTSFYAHISAWVSSVPEMRGCTFENLTGDMSGYGIYALNSTVNVTKHLYMPYTNSPYRACTFTGFGDAVSASNDATAGLTVQYAGFTNNICGIRAAGTSTTNLRFNSINLGTSTTSSTRYGIHVTSANAPYIGFNSIMKQLSAGNHVSGTGIYLNGCGTGFYQVADNTISYMQDGIRTVGDNGGLYIRCNTITNNANGVNSAGQIHDPQGSLSASAGNVFSGNTVDLNDSGYGYDYYYYGTAPSTNTLTGGGGGTPANRIGGGFSNSGFITLISANADGCSGGGGQPDMVGDNSQDNAPASDLQQYLHYRSMAASVTDEAGHQSLESEMAELSAKALNRLTSGTDSWRMDSLKMWYGAMDYPYAKYALAELHAACGETAKADSIIAALPDMTVLSEDGYAEYASYLQYYSLYRTLGLSGRTWADMMDGETQSLKTIAEQGTGKAKARAGFILCFFGVECHTDGDGTQQQEDTEAVGNAMPAHHGTKDGDREERNAARVHPNPTDGTLTVEADGIAEVTIYGTDGTKLAGKRIDGTATLDLSGLATGIYFYEIRTDNGTVYGKLMKK